MKMRNILLKLSTVVCSVAFMVAISSIDKMCMATFYQPEVPNSLEKYRTEA